VSLVTELTDQAMFMRVGADDLDDPVRAALATRHAGFAERRGGAWRYPRAVSGFFALPAEPRPADWTDAAGLLGPGGVGALVRPTPATLPDGWEGLRRFQALQMVGTVALGRPDPEAVRLTPADVPEMIDLVTRTEPGPFGPRTIELGTYLGVRDGGTLVAMAGERLSAEGWTELSAVCTDPRYRGRGLAARLMGAVAQVIEQRGDRLVLHVKTDNAGAIALYERLGFIARRTLTIDVIKAPDR
jgi:ribosomal protein S18 acetylase RimI-like enzyme